MVPLGGNGLSLETDKIYPSIRLLLTFLLQNNKMHMVQDIKKPNSKNMPKFFVLTCKKKPSLILRYFVNTKSIQNLMRETKSNDSEMAKME